MNILSLNCWGGRLKQPLLSFFATHQDIDIFCLQEVFSADNAAAARDYRPDFDFKLYDDIAALLPDHVGYFGENQGDSLWELAIFVRKGIDVHAAGSLPICNLAGDHPRHLQYVTLTADNKPITVANVHGAWIKEGKYDIPERIRQSEIIIEFLRSLNGEKILVGDFNLLPETRSIKLLEEHFKNLIAAYNISSTRTKFYIKSLDQFADYIFLSDGVEAQTLSVLPDEISDHAPLLLSARI